GSIKINGATSGGIAKTDEGNIILSLPDRMNADLALSSNGGTVETTRRLDSSAASNKHFVHGQLGQGGQVLAAHSEFGQVILTRPGEEPNIRSKPQGDINTPSKDLPVREAAGSSTPALRRPEDRPIATPSAASADSSNDDLSDNILRIESRLVTVNASVSNENGLPIVNLRKEDFTLFEDGVQQEVVHFQPVNTPFNMVLLIDLSGSVHEKINLIRNAARKFIQATRSDDKVAIVTFSSSTQLVCPLTNNRSELYRRLDDIKKPDGGTNFYDAVNDTFKLVLDKVRGERNVIVIMSDGVDNALPGVPGHGSEMSFEELTSRVQESDSLIFPIYLDTEAETVDEFGPKIEKAYEIARKQLKELADDTGGIMFYANRVEDLEGRYDQVAAELRTIYSLGYYPTNSAKDGSFHKTRLRVSAEDAGVRARRGYYAKN